MAARDNIPSDLEKSVEVQQKSIHFADVMNTQAAVALTAVHGDVSTAKAVGITPELAQLSDMVANGEQVVAKRGDMTVPQLQAAVGANENAIVQVQQLIGNKSAELDAHSALTGLAG